jgi:putative ABC transport system permease protein
MQNLKYALRQLVRSPVHSATVILILALGIGANTAIFSLVQSVLLKPLPYAEPERVMFLHQSYKQSRSIPFSWPNFQDLRRDAKSFSAMAIFQGGAFTLSGRGAAEQVRGGLVSSDFFAVIAIPPLLGRGFTAEEDRVGGPKVVLIKQSLWQRKFAGSPDVLGQAVTLDGVAYTIIGVLPDSVVSPGGSDFWLPITQFSNNESWQRRGNQPGLFGYGRLAPGVTLTQAADEARRIGERLQRDFPDVNTDTLPVVVPLLSRITGPYQSALWMLMGAVGLLLAIACANVASLQIARGLVRVQEFSIRAALGSGRGRLVWQVLVENLMLAVIGGGLGVLLAFWSIDLIKALSPDTPRFQHLAVDTPVLAFCVGASALTGLLAGLWPAFRAARTDLREALQSGGAKGAVGTGSQLGRQSIVALQVALTVMLLAGAGLFARSLVRIQQFQFGFDPKNLLVFTVSVPEDAGAYTTVEKRIAFFAALKSRLAALPGVQSVGMNYSLPLRTQWQQFFDVAGRTPYAPGSEPQIEMGVIDADYFKTLGVPLLRGRSFDATDRPGQPSRAIIDQRMADAIWPGENPIGKLIHRGRAANRDPKDQGTEIIGVVPTLGLNGIDEVPANSFQCYLAQSQEGSNEMSFVLRTTVEPRSLLESARAAVMAVDSTVPVYASATLEEIIAASHASQTLYSRLVAVFAGAALLLACLGLNGVVAHAVAARRREIGIRMALGALATQVVGLVLRQGVVPMLAGLGAGLAGALLSGRYLASLLYKVSPYDAPSLAAASLVLVAVGLFALWLPARRASRINPIEALRSE